MPQPIRQLLPGVVHWTAIHPHTGLESSSYVLTETGVALDPILPEEGLGWFDEHGVKVREILLSNRHHLRSSREFVAHFGCGVHASRPGMHEFSAADGVKPFDFGTTLAGGVVAREIGAICPDETALVIPDVRAVVVADGVANYGGLQFFEDELLGDDPVAVKEGLLAAYARLVDDVDFDHLLPAHGPPIIGNGRIALRDFVALTGAF